MTIQEPLISVIVPIFKIERYVGLCIESIMSQTYRNLEIILVDDGSPDRCPDLCDLYAQKDPRIRVIHKANGGLVSARKAGLAAANGEYVGYVDGDDWIEPGFYKALADTMQEAGSDIVIAGMSKDLFASSSRITSEIPAGSYEGERLDLLKRSMMIYGKFARIGITTYVWNKLFKREMLLPCQMAVDNGIWIGEDAAVTYPYLMACSKVSVTDECGYHYRQHEDSMLKKTSGFSKEVVGLKKLYAHLMQAAAPYGTELHYTEQIRDFILSTCIVRSGGVLNEVCSDSLLYGDRFLGKRVAVFNAGTFGQQLVRRIEEQKNCTIAGWVDVDYREYRRCCLNVDPIDSIDYMDFDYVLVATMDGVLADDIRSKLLWRGIPEEKILTVNCPEATRNELLEAFLSL